MNGDVAAIKCGGGTREAKVGRKVNKAKQSRGLPHPCRSLLPYQELTSAQAQPCSLALLIHYERHFSTINTPDDPNYRVTKS